MKTVPVEAGSGQDTVEFSRLVSVDDLRPGVIERDFVADPEESEALAGRFGVTAVRNLKVHAVLRRKGRSHIVALEGRFEAEVEQPCVVTLEPVIETLSESFVLRFTLDPTKVRSESADGAGLEILIDPEADDPPEPAGEKGIDVGEAVAQQLSVAINPYPRAQGLAPGGEVFSAVRKDGAQSEDDETSEKPEGVNPFAILETLKSGKKDSED